MMATPTELENSCTGSRFLFFSDHNFLSVYAGILECLLDDSLEVYDLFGVAQLRKQVCFGVALPRYVVHLKAFEVVNKSSGNIIVLE